MNRQLADAKIAVVGLGYVGLPLALAFGQHHDTLGFDLNTVRINELRDGFDHTHEASAQELAASPRLRYSADAADLRDRNVYVITVPTPIDSHKRPDFLPLIGASETVAHALSAGDLVIYESTVYPGATEEVCVPVLEAVSGLAFNRDFFVGYSPERINPGDKRHRLADICKVTAGSTPETGDFVDALYRGIIRAGTYRVSSLKAAEASKIVENTQRDVNIALMNELSILFHKLGLNTVEVLEAAGTKWNFLPFRPGLVGGHCIGVDPYYLTYKAHKVGYYPEVILAGRRINDGMGDYVAQRVIRLMLRQQMHIAGARVLILGFTFKENCPDTRNSRVWDIVRDLRDMHAQVDVHDPWAEPSAVMAEYGFNLLDALPDGAYDAIILAAPHQCFIDWGAERIRRFGKTKAVIFDVKGVLPAGVADEAL